MDDECGCEFCVQDKMLILDDQWENKKSVVYGVKAIASTKRKKKKKEI